MDLGKKIRNEVPGPLLAGLIDNKGKLCEHWVYDNHWPIDVLEVISHNIADYFFSDTIQTIRLITQQEINPKMLTLTLDNINIIAKKREDKILCVVVQNVNFGLVIAKLNNI